MLDGKLRLMWRRNSAPLKGQEQFELEAKTLASFRGQPPDAWAAFLCAERGWARTSLWKTIVLATTLPLDP